MGVVVGKHPVTIDVIFLIHVSVDIVWYSVIDVIHGGQSYADPFVHIAVCDDGGLVNPDVKVADHADRSGLIEVEHYTVGLRNADNAKNSIQLGELAIHYGKVFTYLKIMGVGQ